MISTSTFFVIRCSGKDVDECAHQSLNDCASDAKCVDNPGSFTCKCKSRFKHGDGRNDGSGCKLSSRIHDIIIILPSKSYQ